MHYRTFDCLVASPAAAARPCMIGSACALVAAISSPGPQRFPGWVGVGPASNTGSGERDDLAGTSRVRLPSPPLGFA
jgi:hypothetical protein